MFFNRYRLGVGLTTLVVSALAFPAAFGQVVEMPTISGGWGATAAALDPVTGDIMVVGAGFTLPGYFDASAVSFNGSVGGIVQTSVSSQGMNWPNACAIDYAGRLLSAGSSAAKSGGVFTTVRYNANGSLDTTFGNKGIVTTQFKSSNEAAIYAMTMQGSGSSEKIVVAGNNGELNPVLLAQVHGERGAGHHLRLRRHGEHHHALRVPDRGGRRPAVQRRHHRLRRRGREQRGGSHGLDALHR